MANKIHPRIQFTSEVYCVAKAPFTLRAMKYRMASLASVNSPAMRWIAAMYIYILELLVFMFY